jgi:Flp pilus assembly pilin Flp
MQDIFKEFRSDDSGAVSVEWVVLTAMIVGIAAGGALATRNGLVAAAENVDATLEETEVK